MKRIQVHRVALLIAALSAAAWAEEAEKPAAELHMGTMVVTPTLSEQPISTTAPAITVITAQDLERKQVTTVADALREVPGLHVLESGSRGSVLSIVMRGADSDQVLVRIDNVRANSTTLGSFDFAG